MAYRKLVIFDMDGLMFDTEELNFRTYSAAAREFGYTLPRETFCRLLGGSRERNNGILREAMGAGYPLEQVAERNRAAFSAYIEANGVPVKPGLYELLRYLKEKKILCAVASSSPEASVRRNLKSAGLDDTFDRLYYREKVADVKPSPEIFLGPCRELGVAPGEALVLEDSENGILAAHRAGIPVVCVPDMKYPAPEYATLTLAICGSLSQTVPYMEQTENDGTGNV